MPEIMNILGLDLWSNGIRYRKDGTDAKGSCFKVRVDDCNELYMNIMYTEKDPSMSAVDGRGRLDSVPGRSIRQSPSCPWTDGVLPSRPQPE